jgi:hypothetical protein
VGMMAWSSGNPNAKRKMPFSSMSNVEVVLRHFSRHRN